jgi:hypothetical protein
MIGPSLDSGDAFALLVAAPGTKEEKQRFFIERFEVKAPRTNYDLMWDGLVEELGENQAAEVVCSLALSSADSRAIRLLQRAARGRPVGLRLNEPSLVDLLFEADDELTTIGEALADRLRQAQSPVPGPARPPSRPTETPTPTAPIPARAPTSTEGANVILHWRRAEPHTPNRGPWRWSSCLYAYLHPATQEVLYIGKTDDLTVRQRFVSNFKRKFHHLYTRLDILKVDVIAANVELTTSARLTREWLDDLESLLIFRLQPPLNDSKRNSRRATRPGTAVACTGDWPLARARFVDRG